MERASKKDMLSDVHEILRRRYGKLTPISGQGILKGERIGFEFEGKSASGIIKASSGGRVSFGWRDGKWSGLDDSDFVIIVAPTGLQTDELMVSMFDQRTIQTAFDANRSAQEQAERGHLPNWIAPFHERGRGPRGVGDGFGEKALWSEPLKPSSTPPSPAVTVAGGLTIAEAKQGLAKTFGVHTDAIEITIRG